MAAKPIDSIKAEKIVAEWRTGEYSQQYLADYHMVSKGLVNKLCKGVPQDNASIVTAGIAYRSGLVGQDDRSVTAVTTAVDKKVLRLEWLNEAAIENVKQAMALPCEDQTDHKFRGETILRAKETIAGKGPETAVQVNNIQPFQGIKLEVIRPDHG